MNGNLQVSILLKDANLDEKQIYISSLTQSEKDVFKGYVDRTTLLMEIGQLFQIYLFNLHNLMTYYDIDAGDFVKQNNTTLFVENEYVAINSLVINHISAAKTLVEALEKYIKLFLPEKIKKFLSDLYDDSFSYRLLLMFRNFSQHGHLPLSIDDDGSYYFDFFQILSTRHFNINASIKKEMLDTKSVLVDEYGTLPKIAFRSTLAEFTYYVFKVYNDFFDNIRTDFFHFNTIKNNLIKEKPYLIYNSNDQFNRIVIYDINIELEMFDSFIYDDNSREMFNQMKKEAVECIKIYNGNKKK